MSRAVALAAAVLVLTAACGAAVAAGRPSGIAGQVREGPTCPVQRPGQRCDRPFQTTLAIYTVARHRLVKKVRTARDGRFRTRLAPGRYRIEGAAHRAKFPTAKPVDVTVRAHRFTRVGLMFDTGIR